MRVDLNADMGETVKGMPTGDDAALLDIVTSANIACALHAGDPNAMAHSFALARDKRVGAGAHPGFPDLENFGRKRMDLPPKTVQNLVAYQVAASAGMARAAGIELTHVKLHGALANMCAEDTELAKHAFDGALSVAPEALLMVIAASAQVEAAEALGAAYVTEIFADRAYTAKGGLVDRSQPGAVIHDAAEAADRVAQMVAKGAILTVDGDWIECPIDTICCHGDTPDAVNIARLVRRTLETEGHLVTRFVRA